MEALSLRVLVWNIDVGPLWLHGFSTFGGGPGRLPLKGALLAALWEQGFWAELEDIGPQRHREEIARSPRPCNK